MQNNLDVFSKINLPKMIDISALSVWTSMKDVDNLADAANENGFMAAFVMPCYIEHLKSRLGENTNVIIGATVGFPTGADLTQDKIFQVKEMKKYGCREFDMVLCVGMLKSGNLEYVKKDIASVVDAADGYPVKVILEVTYLEDDEIKIASEIVAASGAKYVKTGTGYAPKPTLVHHVELMKQTVGDSIKIKCAGGIKDLKQLQDFYHAGATRFGIGLQSALNILYSAQG